MSSPVGPLRLHPSGATRKVVGALSLLLSICLLLTGNALLAAEEQPAKPAAPSRGLDNLKLPSDAVIVIVEEARDALKRIPHAFVVAPEEYQKLPDEIVRLRGQAKPEKPVSPTSCKLTGRVEGDLARLRAEFGFSTDRRNALVALGCGQGHPTAVTLDERLPVLTHGDDGYVLQVEEPGVHKAVLDFDLPLAVKGGGTLRGLDLDLPRAAVTTLELDLPPSVKEARVGGTSLPARPTEDKRHSRLDTGGLGALDRLEVTWKAPASKTSAVTLPPLRTVEGRISVQVHETFVETVAELTLSVLRGQTDRWQLQLPTVPAQGSLEIQTPGAEERVQAIEQPAGKGTLRTIRLREPSAEPLRVVVQLQQPRGSGSLPVGPFHVQGAFRQRGTVLIAVPPDVRPRFQPRAEVSPRDLTADDSRRDFRPTAAFIYSLPALEKPPASPPPLLGLELETIKGTVEARIDHTLTLSERGWQVQTRIQVTPPLRGELRELTVELPVGYEAEERQRRAGEPVREITIDPESREATIALDDKQVKPFTVTLDGRLPPPAAGTRQAALELPVLKLERAQDRGGEVIVILPEELELTAPAPRDAADRKHNRAVWRFERMPSRVELSWRPYRPDLPLDAIVEIDLRGSQAGVVHRLWPSSAQPLPKGSRLLVQVPDALADRIVRVQRGQWAAGTRGGGSRSLELTEPVSRTAPLVLEYFFSLPARNGEEGSRPLAVPLVVPEQATRGEIRVRVWSEPETLPELPAGAAWEKLPPEAAEGRHRLTDLCVRGSRPDLPLALLLEPSPVAAETTVLVERALVRATVVQGGPHSCWARFRISQLRAPHLDLELPAPPAGINLRVFLDGRAVPWKPVSDGTGGGDTSRLARLSDLEGRVQRPVVLDVLYQLSPAQASARGGSYALGNVALQTTLQPPRLRGGGDHVAVRWDVHLPPDWVPLYTGSSFRFEQQWGWRGWLLAPRPAASSADLDRWFAGDSAAEDPPSAAVEGDLGTEPSGVICWRTDLGALRLGHVPQQAWLLGCSLVLLVVGLGLWFVLVQRGVYWPIVALLGVLAAMVGLLWPNILAVVFYGCEPGLAVLAVVFAAQWLLQRRYRRQVVFLPGFTRLRKSGSSLLRSSRSGRPSGEPSTVDAAPPEGSSSQRRGGSSLSSKGGSQSGAPGPSA